MRCLKTKLHRCKGVSRIWKLVYFKMNRSERCSNSKSFTWKEIWGFSAELSLSIKVKRVLFRFLSLSNLGERCSTRLSRSICPSKASKFTIMTRCSYLTPRKKIFSKKSSHLFKAPSMGRIHASSHTVRQELEKLIPWKDRIQDNW